MLAAGKFEREERCLLASRSLCLSGSSVQNKPPPPGVSGSVKEASSKRLLKQEREPRLAHRDLLFSEPHLWRNGFTGVPSAEE